MINFHPSSVQSAWVPMLFQSGYTRGCCSSLQVTDRRWLCLLLEYRAPILKKLPKFSFRHWSQIFHGSLCFSFFFFGSLWEVLRAGGNWACQAAGLRWRCSWGAAVRVAEHRRWDSDGLSMSCRLLPPSHEPAVDSELPSSCREEEEEEESAVGHVVMIMGVRIVIGILCRHNNTCQLLFSPLDVKLRFLYGSDGGLYLSDVLHLFIAPCALLY